MSNDSFTVEANDIRVICHRSNGTAQAIAWDELEAVIIETNADGPFVDDVFWVLLGNGRVCVVPSEAEGEDKLLRRLQELPGFDNSAVVEAMVTTTERRFLCWQRAAVR